MPNYDFKSLSPIDFEILVRDLLQEELKITLESFKTGQDQGIDFRHCPNQDQSLIVQCKHYANSTFNTLHNKLKKEEVDKVKKVSPSRYLLTTSIGLTTKQKDKLLALFEPFIQNTNDIYGNKDLNNLLGKFSRVEKEHFKLWFSSIPVFEKILNSKIINISRDALEKIRINAKYYVHNKSFPEAVKILREHNFCIIAGIPGIGKTVLAEMLLLHYLEQGYEVIKITEDISEASSFDYKNDKKVFYYDDFLGQTSLSEKLNKNEDQKLLDFIHTINRSKTSKLILTTREYILNQARMTYEKIDRAKFDPETYIIDLSKYTRLNRAKILFNHVYFSDLPDKYKNELLNNKSYLKIIDHPNYNPRIIDLMTEYSRINDVEQTSYMKTFMSNLENPLAIWEHAFEHQLSQNARNLLLVLTMLPNEIFLEDLHEAFDNFHEKKAEKYKSEITPNDYKNALKELNGNFINVDKIVNRTVIRFQNPSIKDFLKNYLSSNEFELLAIVESTVFYEQLMLLWGFSKSKSKDLPYRKIIKKYPKEFLKALSRTIKSRTCRLIDSKRDGTYYKTVYELPFEARVTFIASIFDDLRAEELKLLLDDLLLTVEKQVKEKSANREQLVSLLTELTRLQIIDFAKHNSLIENSKIYLMQDLDWLEDFEPFCDFMNGFSKFVSDTEIETVKNNFIRVAEGDWSHIPESPDLYRDDAYKVESLAKCFHIDMQYKIDEFEEKAKELENRLSDESDENDDNYNMQSKGYCSDYDIDSIFNILRE